MVFTHDTQKVLSAAVEIVNDPPATVSQLVDFSRRQGYTGRLDGDEAELAALRALRPRVRSLLLAPRDEAPELINAWFDKIRLRPRLVRHDDLDWHLHGVGGDEPLATRIAVETLMAMVDVVRLDETSRLAVCADPDCDGVVLDLSRNRSRRFCSTTCGNRAAVAAYRERRRVGREA